MKKHLIVIAVIAVMLPGALLAQDELTLESLQNLITALDARLSAIEEQLGTIQVQVKDLEDTLVKEEPVPMTDDGCQIHLNPRVAEARGLKGIRDEAVLKYKEQFDEWLDIGIELELYSVVHDEESGHTFITYDVCCWRFLTETWKGCAFVESSDWWEE